MMAENELLASFSLAVRWKAIMLLDEADVFMQERDLRSGPRNNVVSRKLWSQDSDAWTLRWTILSNVP